MRDEFPERGGSLPTGINRVGKEAAAIALRPLLLFALSFDEKDATNCYRGGIFSG